MSRRFSWDTVPSCLLLAVSVAPPFIKHQLNTSILQPNILEGAGNNLSFPITPGYDLGILSNYFLSTWFIPQWCGVRANTALGFVSQHPKIMQNRVRLKSRQMFINQYHLSAKC